MFSKEYPLPFKEAAMKAIEDVGNNEVGMYFCNRW